MIVPLLWENVAVQGLEFPSLRPAICSYNNNTVLSLLFVYSANPFYLGQPPFQRVLSHTLNPLEAISQPTGWLKWGSGFILKGYNSSTIRCPLPVKALPSAWAVYHGILHHTHWGILHCSSCRSQVGLTTLVVLFIEVNTPKEIHSMMGCKTCMWHVMEE